MYIHRSYGPVMPEHEWAPAPSYLLRRAEIFRVMSTLPPGRALEVGCGAGTLAFELAARGFTVDALETSAPARAVAEDLNAGVDSVCIHAEAQPGWEGAFAYVLAFEVLEHIEDDAGALRQWREWLASGGHLVLSVPAHQDRWDVDDEVAGHVRRYEAPRLQELVRDSGFEVLDLRGYGFPLTSMLRPLRIRKYRRLAAEFKAGAASGQGGGNEHSGIARREESRAFSVLSSPPGRIGMLGADLLQRLFSRTSLGDGMLLLARRAV